MYIIFLHHVHIYLYLFSNISKNSFESPDITGSSLTLATAGSRRTVYLVEENQQTKISETSSSKLETTGISVRSSSSSSTSTLDAINNITNETTNSATSSTNSRHKTENSASTYLIYNRINTIIGGGATGNGSGSYVGGSSGVSSALNLSSISDSNNSCVTVGNTNRLDDSKLSRRRSDDKSNSVWYEYGCV